MAELKNGSTSGGSPIWTGTNLPIKMNGPIISYNDDRIFTEAYPPTALDIDAVKKTGDTMSGELAIKATAGDNTLLLQSAANADTAIILTEHVSASGVIQHGASLKYNGSDYNGVVLDVMQDGVTRNVFKASGYKGELTFAVNPLTLAVQSAAANSLTRRDYVDQQVDTCVSKTGDIMTGSLVINKAGTAITFKGTAAGTAASSYIAFADSNDVRQGYIGTSSPSNTDLYINAEASNVQIIAKGYTNIDTPRSSVAQEDNPAALTRKDYVDEKVGEGSTNKVDRTGDTMTGELSIKTTNNNRLLLASGSNKNTSVVMAEAMNSETVIHGAEVKYEGENNDFEINVSYNSNSKNVLKANITDGVAKFTSNPLSIAEQSDEVNALTRKDYVDNQAFRYYLQTTPDVHLPLKHDLHIREGSGDSIAQKDCVFVENKLFFEDNNLTFDVPVVNAVSVNLGDMNGMTKWTPNYNGVNSYVSIPEWKPAGEFEIECDVYIPIATQNSMVLGTENGGILGIHVGKWKLLGQEIDVPNTTGFNHIACSASSFGAFNSLRYIGRGSDSALSTFKGQISNLRLTDKTNPDNSRFYPGVIYSYVDPDAVDVEMPNSTILVDELCKGKQLNTQTVVPSFGVANTSVASSKIAGVTPEVGKTYRVTGDVVSADNHSLIGISSSSGAGQEIGGIRGKGRLDVTYKASSVSGAITGLYLASWGNGNVTVENLVWEEVTHGILNNFGTTQPWVPLLGEREGYNSSFSLNNYIRGVKQADANITSAPYNGVVGSYYGRTSTVPAESVLFSEDVFLRVKLLTDNQTLTLYPFDISKAQHAFQYPRTFTVIQPTDEDYKDYLPEVNTKWTPNYNGTNSYVEIPEWKPAGEFEIEVDVRVNSAVSTIGLHNMILGQAVTGGFNVAAVMLANGEHFIRTYSGADGAGIREALDVPFNGGLGCYQHIKLKWSEDNTLTVTTSVMTKSFRFTSGVETVRKGFICIGAKQVANTYNDRLKGQISNLRLTDKTNPQNSRFYPGVIYDYVDPDATEVHMHQTTRLADWGPSAQHGVIVNFGTEQPWVPLLGEREEYCGEFSVEPYRRGCAETGKGTHLTSRNSPGKAASSFSGKWLTDEMTNFILQSGSEVHRVTGNNSTIDVQLGGTFGVQHAFQYPNTFKVIKPDDPDHPDYKEYDWTLNFNGVNSYVEIPEWEPERLQIDLNLLWQPGTSGFLVGSKINPGLKLEAQRDGRVTFASGWSNPSATINGVVNGLLSPGVNTIVFTANTPVYSVSTVGARLEGNLPYKGQISNLRLTDLDNPDNSRFYPIVETSHKMPTGTVVVDTQSMPVYEKKFTIDVIEADKGLIRFAATEAEVAALQDWYYDQAADRGYVNTYKTGRLAHSSGRGYVYLADVKNISHFDVGDQITFTKSMQGTAVNFGTSAPWVPHLEEGEGYVGNYSDSNFNRGVWIEVPQKNIDLHVSEGEPKKIPSDEILTAYNGASLKVWSGDGGRVLKTLWVSGSDHEIQQGFQYPNVFTITPPSEVVTETFPTTFLVDSVTESEGNTEVIPQSDSAVGDLNLWYNEDTTRTKCNMNRIVRCEWVSIGGQPPVFKVVLQGVGLGITTGSDLTFVRTQEP